MNIEQAFIKSQNPFEVIVHIENRLKFGPETGEVLKIEVPDSYNSIIAKDSKRKIAVSGSTGGWISVLESKEVNDYGMLLNLSKELCTDVICVVISDVTGSCGFVEFNNGEIINGVFYEYKNDIERFINSILYKKGITIPLLMFKEVFADKDNGWAICKRNK